MRQKLVSIGDDFWIEDNHGNRCFKVDGKALRMRQTLKFEDDQGNELLKIQERVARVRDTMKIEDAIRQHRGHGQEGHHQPDARTVECRCRRRPRHESAGKHRRPRVHHRGQGQTAAEVSKRWFRVADTYGVEVGQGQNPILMLALVAVIDEMAHADR